jgi:hypothetical protein
MIDTKALRDAAEAPISKRMNGVIVEPDTVIALLDVVDAARAKKQAVDAIRSGPNLDNLDLAEKFQEMGRLDDRIFAALEKLEGEQP